MAKIDGSVPQCYTLALRQRAGLARHFHDLEAKAESTSRASKLTAFLKILEGHMCSVNMSIPSCVRFLEKRRLLNIYEAIFADSGKTGRAMAEAVRKKIPKWYKQRRIFERVLHFRRDTHYTAINLGGAGAIRYGICCVVFDLGGRKDYSTCFGGDSLRAAFDASGKRILDDAQLFSRFATHADLGLLAATRHSAVVLDGQPSISRAELRGIMENSDSLIEIYLHGALTLADVSYVAISQRDLYHLWDLTLRADREGKPWNEAMEFDAVEPFKKMIALLEQNQIPLLEAEAD